jgi:hypothetical protein
MQLPGPFDSGGRDVKGRHLESEIVQISRIVTQAAADNQGLSAVALQMVLLGPLAEKPVRFEIRPWYDIRVSVRLFV